MIITRARTDDIDTIMAWRAELTGWLRQRGETQWQDYPLPRRAVSATVETGQTWLVWDGARPVGTLTLAAAAEVDGLWHRDPDPAPLWYPQDDTADALYAAKMMVPRAEAGRGLGAEMLAWAGGRAYDAEVSWLRLDAWSTNAGLHAYYERLGFRHVRTVASRTSGACFQRPAQPYHGPLKTES